MTAPQYLGIKVPTPLLYAAVYPPLFHDMQALLPSRKFRPLLTLTDLDATAAASVLAPAASDAATDAATSSATADASALVPPAFHAFGCIDIVAHVNTIFQIYP